MDRSILLIDVCIGTVSATYGTLIVLAISFAIAAIGNILTPSFSGNIIQLEVISISHVPGALLYYGLLSMREQRYGSSQYYARYLAVLTVKHSKPNQASHQHSKVSFSSSIVANHQGKE